MLEALVLGHLLRRQPLPGEPEEIGAAALPRPRGRHADERDRHARPDRRALLGQQRVDLLPVPRPPREGALELPGDEVEVRGGLVSPPRPEPPVATRRADACREAPVVARRDDVDRRAHQRPLDGATALQRAGQVVAREAVEHRPQPNVRRRRVLRLEAADALERAADREPRPREQELAREERAVQPPRRERHGRTAALR